MLNRNQNEEITHQHELKMSCLSLTGPKVTGHGGMFAALSPLTVLPSRQPVPRGPRPSGHKFHLISFCKSFVPREDSSGTWGVPELPNRTATEERRAGQGPRLPSTPRPAGPRSPVVREPGTEQGAGEKGSGQPPRWQARRQEEYPEVPERGLSSPAQGHNRSLSSAHSGL